MKGMIYFDNAASTKPRPEAVSAMNAVLSESYANPNALHKGGIEAEKIIASSRETLLSLMPKGGDLIFTSGATESNNLAVMGSVKKRGGNKIITTAFEHPGVSGVIGALGSGFDVVRVSPKDNIADFVDENTVLVSVTAVCSETGFIVGVERLYKEIKGRFPDCVIHTDGAQGFLKTPLDGDLISVSAHKIGGVAGVGGLFIKRGVRVIPQIFGGGQQKGLRPGTEPTALIAAFAKAAEAAEPLGAKLQKRLKDGLNRLGGMKINSYNNIDNILNFSCGVKSEVMLRFLAERDIYVSGGSACSRGKRSKILPAFGVSGRDIDSAVRVSFGWQNVAGEVDAFLEALEAGVKRFGT
ncbi:MAG: aminotransferase class V-fold PLP-dependent enzyme [Oscillospiraceae bacterium]|jgi:cysteine desulfurase|nr:aminotransferase class V-fold PLP-dependent enzyme [Oscillospiraceae bacterium]